MVGDQRGATGRPGGCGADEMSGARGRTAVTACVPSHRFASTRLECARPRRARWQRPGARCAPRRARIGIGPDALAGVAADSPSRAPRSIRLCFGWSGNGARGRTRTCGRPLRSRLGGFTRVEALNHLPRDRQTIRRQRHAHCIRFGWHRRACEEQALASRPRSTWQSGGLTSALERAWPWLVPGAPGWRTGSCRRLAGTAAAALSRDPAGPMRRGVTAPMAGSTPVDSARRRRGAGARGGALSPARGGRGPPGRLPGRAPRATPSTSGSCCGRSKRRERCAQRTGARRCPTATTGAPRYASSCPRGGCAG